jgi:hypothetical protein
MIKELSYNTPERINEDQYHPNHPGYYAASWIYPHADALGYVFRAWFIGMFIHPSAEFLDGFIYGLPERQIR